MKTLILLLSMLIPQITQAFCGFYVAKADSSLYNQASQVVMVRKDDKTVLSLMNDYQGELEDFAMVIPVPEVLQKGQVNIGDAEIIKHLDAFTAPRLVEYHDLNPCRPPIAFMDSMAKMSRNKMPMPKTKAKPDLGVIVEAEYTIGEYDIVILSAKESTGLESWLQINGYNIPNGASQALKPYIKQDMKFFVAKVNLKEHSKTKLNFLRPIQFAFQSEKFILPIRLGMINAKGPQDLLLYVLTEKGRVEATNYRTLKLPSSMDLPVYIKKDFARFYQSMFNHQVKQYDLRVVFTEYFWNMGWCDPCAADPLSSNELKKLGVFWLNANAPALRQGLPVQVTRLHVRYTPESFPEDLRLQETGDKQNFQGRYVLRHAWQGKPEQCDAARQYLDNLPIRHQQEARNLAKLTGWSLTEIHRQMDLPKLEKKPEEIWWKGLW